MLAVHDRKGKLCFAMRSPLRFWEKQHEVGVILLVDEKKNPASLIAEARRSVFAGRKPLAGGYERKRHFHYDLILGLRRKSEASEGGQDDKNTQE